MQRLFCLRRGSLKWMRAFMFFVLMKTVVFIYFLEIHCYGKFEVCFSVNQARGGSSIPTRLLPKTIKNEFLPNRSLRTKKNERRRNKTILIWNSPGRIETSVFGFGHKPFVRHRCEFSECILYKKKSALPVKSYDAIIIHMHELWLSKLPHFRRRENQRFIFLTQESPATMPIDVSKMNNFFNWTMSYRLNSDVQLLYGRILPRPTAPTTVDKTFELIKKMHSPSAKNYAANKTRPVAWMATHCNTPSLRETYVRQLRKFIPVDIYGGCGNLTCERNQSHWLSHPKCYDMLETKYKFYLSFENSMCDDYVTEKFFLVLDHNIVPVVYGKANYSIIAPFHSYIDAMQFTPESLAQYLKVLDANDTLYNEYFWWKSHYVVEAGVEQMARHGFCDLCKKLHEEQDVKKYYSELVSDWHPQNTCAQTSSWETRS